MAIIRMALHFQGQSTAYLHRSSEWRLIAQNHVGSTLGISDSDFDNLNIIESTIISETSNCRKLELLTQQDEEADRLDQEMHSITWKKVCSILDNTIAQMPASTIRAALELRWRLWKEPLNNSEAEQKAICLSMLHPNAEGKGIRVELRVGPKTSMLIAKGLFLLLTVSIGLNPTDNGRKEFGAMLSVQTRAISHWSGPEGSSRTPRKLTDDDMSYLLGKEPAKILLLPNIDESPSNIYEENLASAKERTNTLTDQHLPLLLITNSIKLRGIINRGDLTELSEYLQSELDKGIKI
ncbi:MAG: hypothetical protein K0Q79_696 [Flavipsychrobacter sp.]|jgi:hypothetical protein|nr:hypothetical protein [Flavipsychrobacter sp.]